MESPIKKIVYSQEIKRLITERIKQHDISTKSLCDELSIEYCHYKSYINKVYSFDEKPPISVNKLLDILNILGITVKVVIVTNEIDKKRIEKIKEENILKYEKKRTITGV